MLLFKDIITGDEMFTDSFKFELKDDAFYYVTGKLVQVGAEEISDSLLGGNKSAEDVDDGGAVNTELETKIDVVNVNRLVETGFGTKKEYAAYLKAFLTKVKERKIANKELEDNEAAIKKWQTAVQSAVKKHILDVFSDLQWFMGESMNPEGHICAVNYIDDQPVLMFMKDGLMEEKA